MSKSVQVLAMLAALAASTPALAQYGESDATYSSQSASQSASSWSSFAYQRFRFQIEGGPTFTSGVEGRNLDSGENLGLGFTFQPLSHLPLGIRVDGMYGRFHDKPPLLAQGAASLGTAVDWGHTEMWGGDVDAELDTMLAPWARLYLLAGGGWYDIRDRFYQAGVFNGVVCGWFYCFQGPVLAGYRVGETSTGMRFEKNAGAGLEFPVGRGVSLFVDARYMLFTQRGQRIDFIPVRVGLRF